MIKLLTVAFAVQLDMLALRHSASTGDRSTVTANSSARLNTVVRQQMQDCDLQNQLPTAGAQELTSAHLTPCAVERFEHVLHDQEELQHYKLGVPPKALPDELETLAYFVNFNTSSQAP